MAPAEAASSLSITPAVATAPSKAMMFLSMNFTPALPLWASLGLTVLGFAVGGLLMYLAFRVQKWMSSSECREEKLSLVPNAEGECDSENSTACSSWPGEQPGRDDAAPEGEATMSWTVLATTFLFALPSVLGTWCWPLLLAALIPAASGSIETDANREAFHHFTFGADIALFGAVIGYLARMTSRGPTSQSFISRYGPLVMVSLGCFLLILDPTRHILLDHGGVFFKERDLAMYSGRYPGELSSVGKFCQTVSIAGMVLLVAGVTWHMRLPEAVIKKFSGTTDSKAAYGSTNGA